MLAKVKKIDMYHICKVLENEILRSKAFTSGELFYMKNNICLVSSGHDFEIVHPSYLINKVD